MDNLIQISKINDFIFCPYSIYLHSIYNSFSSYTYHSRYQRMGKIKHENIDTGQYSTAKKYLQGMSVYSEEWGLVGKIDVYDKESKSLIERKYKIKEVYDGQRYQLFAQKVCMEEMGYEVKDMFIHSLSDNKRYQIPEDEDSLAGFFNTIAEMKVFRLEGWKAQVNPNKCRNCIYATLCEYADTTGF